MLDLEYVREVDDCPSILDLQLYLNGRNLDDSLIRHIKSCDLCKRRLENLKNNPVSLRSLEVDLSQREEEISYLKIPKRKSKIKAGQIWSMGNFKNEMFHRLCVIQSPNSPELFNYYKTVRIIPISPFIEYATEKELIFKEAAEGNPLRISFLCLPRLATTVLRKNLMNYFGIIPNKIIDILNQMTEEIGHRLAISDDLVKKINELENVEIGSPIVSGYDIRRNFLQTQYLSLNELQRPIAELQNKADYFYDLQKSLGEDFKSVAIKWLEKGVEIVSGIGNMIQEPHPAYAFRDASRKTVSKKTEIELCGRKIIFSYFPKDNQISLQIEVRDEIFPEKILDNIWIDVYKGLEKIATLNPPESDTIIIEKDGNYKFVFKYDKKEFGFYELNV